MIATGRVSHPDDAERKLLARARRRKRFVTSRNAERALLENTGIRKLRENPIFKTPRRSGQSATEPRPAVGTSREDRTCYVCHAQYREIHWFYDQLCTACGDYNHAKREQTADLRGRVALVTGSRVKIGYQAVLMLLRSGCRVVCVTRFPHDAARRYASEEDFAEWHDRLQIHGVDLRHVPSVESLCGRLLATLPRLDFLINNACQTVRRPPGFYDHLMANERLGNSPLAAHEARLLPDGQGHGALERRAASDIARLTAAERVVEALSSAEMTQVPLVPEDLERGGALYPSGQLDADGQQIDLRKVNSWRLKLADVPTVELLEVHLVNAVSPFLLNARLKPLMTAVPTADKHIVNVSAVEGQFNRTQKTYRHPHTNMAKASLNMMTRTSAADYVEHGIHMNSVDTGWVTDEDPMAHALSKRAMHNFHPPLDIRDGAARIVDPILHGISTGEHIWGQFLKDYRVTDW